MKKQHWIALTLVALFSFVGEWGSASDPEHAAHFWSAIPGFYAVYGFLGCVAIIVISKWLGKILLQRREDYYE